MRKISYQTLVMLFLALMYSGIVPATETTEPQQQQQDARWCFLLANTPILVIPMVRVFQISAADLETNSAVVQN